MKRNVLIGLAITFLVVGGCTFWLTYSIKQYNIENGIESVTEEQANEINQLGVTNLQVRRDDDEEFVPYEEYDLKAGDTLSCSATLSNGAAVIVSGYVVNGDEDSVEYENGTIKITIKE